MQYFYPLIINDGMRLKLLFSLSEYMSVLRKIMRIRRLLLVIILSVQVSYNPGSIVKNSVITEKLVPGNVRLTNVISSGPEYAAIEKGVNNFLRVWSIAGASIAICKDEKLVYARGFGLADTSSREETQPYHRFRVASISKLVTAVAIMKLNEEGKLYLGEKVFGAGGILDDPFFSNPKDKRVNDITVAHLLSHEGGWTQRWGDQMFMPLVIAEKMGVKPPVDIRTVIRFALDKKLHFTPGSGRAYSNLGYSILGLVIEKVSGQPYEEYCREAILEKLGIFDMTMARNMPSMRAPFEVAYYEAREIVLKPSVYGTGELVAPCYGGNDIETLGAAGAWLATAPDLARLMLAIDGFAGRDDILNPGSIEFMTNSSNGYAPVGWKATNTDGTWWRTGTFPGSAGMIKRQADGYEWVVLMNTSTWNGPEIYSYINNMMCRILSRVKEWPSGRDLFDYSLPVPLNAKMDDNLNAG
jgi:CubicO group peptidase (beta-lactamase class C family)